MDYFDISVTERFTFNTYIAFRIRVFHNNYPIDSGINLNQKFILFKYNKIFLKSTNFHLYFVTILFSISSFSSLLYFPTTHMHTHKFIHHFSQPINRTMSKIHKPSYFQSLFISFYLPSFSVCLFLPSFLSSFFTVPGSILK
jgi:hypothetical protein